MTVFFKQQLRILPQRAIDFCSKGCITRQDSEMATTGRKQRAVRPIFRGSLGRPKGKNISVYVRPCRVSPGALPPAPSPGAPTFQATAECLEPLYRVWALPSSGAFRKPLLSGNFLTFWLTFQCLFYRVPHDLRFRIVPGQQEALHQGDLVR